MPRTDTTIEWMTDDIASRCRSVVATLSDPRSSLSSLDEAASTLRGAADDLASVLLLLDDVGATATRAPSAFELALGVSRPSAP